MWPSSNNSAGAYSSSGQWSFNPAVYQNIPYEQVDWASLAQQWIKMKETMPSVNQGPPPPPAPQISTKSSSAAAPPTSTPTVVESQQNDIEGGEAPMDMDTKEDDTPSGSVGVAPDGNWNQWGNWQSQWGWGWPGNAGTVPLADNTQSTSSTVDSKVKSQNNDSIPVLNNYVSNVSNFPVIRNIGTTTPHVPGSSNYTNTASGMIPPDLPKSGYWNDNFSSGSGKSVTETWIKSGKIGNRHQHKLGPAEQILVIDAAKKKQLPAWIREGLNKMEREKQKKLERERMMQEKLIRDQIKSEELLQEVSVDNIQSFNMSVPKEDQTRKSPPPAFNSRYQQKNYASSAIVEPVRQRPSRTNKEDSSSIRKTKDQIMEESMLKVRRILTEILLEATENQVQVIAKEEYRRAKSSASAQQIRKSNALTSLTGNLGLDIYESESESSGSDRERDDKKGDSDEELKILIERKKREFQRIEDEIEQEIEDQEAKERLIAQQEYGSDNDDDGYEDREDDTEANKFRDRTNYEPVHNPQEHTKNTTERIPPTNHSRFDQVQHRNENRVDGPQKQTSHGDKINGDKAEKSKSRKAEKTKSKSSSSSSSSSASTSSSSSSARSSSGSSSSNSSNSSNSESEYSTSNGHPSRRKKRKRKVKTKDKTDTESKRKRYRSRSRSTSRSRSRYTRSDKYGVSRNRKSESSDRKRSSPHRRRSPSYHRRRSPSYHRENSEIFRSKYRESSSRRRDSDMKRRRRSSSTESRHSRYKRR